MKELPIQAHLTTMGIEELKHLSAKAVRQHELILPSVPLPINENPLPTWVVIILCCTALIIVYIGITCYYRRRYPFPLIMNTPMDMEVQPRQPHQPSASL